jgi:hypothetical protein
LNLTEQGFVSKKIAFGFGIGDSPIRPIREVRQSSHSADLAGILLRRLLPAIMIINRQLNAFDSSTLPQSLLFVCSEMCAHRLKMWREHTTRASSKNSS